MSRREFEEIREKTMQIIFAMDAMNDFDYNNIAIIAENRDVLSENRALITLDAIKEHIAEIDEAILSCTDNWKVDRIAKTDLAILRNAVAEMKYNDKIPNAVAINEAVNLAKKYGDDKSYAFVNSVLSKVNKSLEA